MTFPLAEFDFTPLIYLLVGAFWLFNNIMQGKQAKKKAEEMRKRREEREREEQRTGKKAPTPPPAKKPQNDLETFLRGLSEQINPTPPSPPPIPTQKEKKPEILFNGPPPPPVTNQAASPLAKLPEKAKASKSYDIGDLDMEASFKQMSDIKEAVELIDGGIDQKIQQEALKNVRSMMIDLSSSSISVPSVHLQSIRAIRTETPRPKLNKRSTFKKALVASVILEAPKALREDPFKEIN